MRIILTKAAPVSTAVIDLRSGTTAVDRVIHELIHAAGGTGRPYDPCMVEMSFAEFEAACRAQGFDEVLERVWAPNTVLETHVHPSAVRALVVAGEMWLAVGEQTRHLRPGDTFELDHRIPHAERYGGTGATYWVARRSIPV